MKTTTLKKLILISLSLIYFHPTFSQIVGNNSVCSNSTELYSTNLLAETYNWNVTGAANYHATGNQLTVLWGNGSSGQINLIAFDNLGTIVGTQQKNITIKPSPNAFITSAFNSSCFYVDESNNYHLSNDTCLSACKGRTIRYYAPTGASNYQWNVTGADTFIIDPFYPREINITWSQSDMGYIQLIQTGTNGCLDSAYRCVKLYDTPEALFYPDIVFLIDTHKVCQDAPISFLNRSKRANNYLWDFGDGNTSTDPSPIYSYADSGYYTVTLRAYNDCYCYDEQQRLVYVSPKPAITVDCIRTMCLNDTLTLQVSDQCLGMPIQVQTSYHLNVLNINQADRTIKIRVTGEDAKLSVDIPNCDQVCPFDVDIPRIPVVTSNNTIEGDGEVCAGEQGVYYIKTLPGANYTWSILPPAKIMGVNNESEVRLEFEEGAPPSTVVLNLTYDHPLLGCQGSSTKEIRIRGNIEITQAEAISCTQSQSVYAANNSVNWSISDASGNTVFSLANNSSFPVNWQNTPAGTYQVTATAINPIDYCDSSITRTIELDAGSDAPTQISGDTLICAGNAYTYSVPPQSNLLSEWHVIGGTPIFKNGHKIGVRWGVAPPYILKAIYSRNTPPYCSSDTTELVVSSKINAFPAILGNNMACPSDTTWFETSITPNAITWQIEPDTAGSIVTDRLSQKIGVVFSLNDSNLNATIKAQFNVCGNPFNLSKTVTINGFPESSISYQVLDSCYGNDIQFTATGGANWSWTIAGINYQGQTTPVIHFDTAGNYPIKLRSTIKNTSCVNESFTTIPIVVREQALAKFSVIDTNYDYCVDTLYPVDFIATQQPNIQSYEWYYNDTLVGQGVFYNDFRFGDYKLVVTDTNNCISTSSIKTLKKDCPTGQSLNCDTAVFIAFTNTGKCGEYYLSSLNLSQGTLIDYEVKWGDFPRGIRGQVGPFQSSNQYAQAGVYNVAVLGSYWAIIDGVLDTICFRVRKDLYVQSMLDFKPYMLECQGNQKLYELENNSTYIIDPPLYSWNLGGMGTSSQNNPQVLLNAGNWTITLQDSSGCSITKNFNVSPPPQASFVTSPVACQQEPMAFNSTSTGNILDYRWNLGGKDYRGANVVSTFELNGNNSQNIDRDLKLFVLDEVGCRDTMLQQITIKGNGINKLFQISFTQTDFCEGDSSKIEINPSPFSTNNPVDVLWSNLKTTNDIWAKQAGDYQALFTDAAGCRLQTDEVNIGVISAAIPVISGENEYCLGDSTQLNAYVGQGATYQWKVNGNLVQTGKLSTLKMALAAGTHSIEVNAQDSLSSCWASSSPYQVQVRTITPTTIVPNGTSPVCASKQTFLQGWGAVGSFNWSTGESSNTIIAQKEGWYALSITNNQGCVAVDSIFVNPVPDLRNFLSGCYCFADSGAVTLYTNPDYQVTWYNANNLVNPQPIPDEQLAITNSGSYSISAISDSGCVANSAIADIQIGNCDNCKTNVFAPQLSCVSVDSIGNVTFDVSILVYNNGDPAAFTANAYINGTSISGFQLNTNTISSGLQSLNGTFTTQGVDSSSQFCINIQLDSSQSNCQLNVCVPFPTPNCEVNADFSWSIDPISCQLKLEDKSTVPACMTLPKHQVNWLIGGNTYQGTPYYLNLAAGTYPITLNRTGTAYDGSTCIGSAGTEIEIPECPCEECREIELQAQFKQFIDNCRAEIDLAWNNWGNDLTYIGATSSHGTITAINNRSLSHGSGNTSLFFQPNYDVNFREEVCIKIYFSFDGEICCQEICLMLEDCTFLRKKQKQENSIQKTEVIGLQIQPNPARRQVKITWPKQGISQSGVLKLYNYKGQLIWQKLISTISNSYQLNLDNYLSGAYVIQWQQGDINIQEKLIILP